MSNNFKGLCCIVFLGLQFRVSAQNQAGLSHYQSLFYSQDSARILDLSLQLDAQTSHHNFDFIQSLYRSRFISDALIEENSKLLNLSNKVGFESAIGGQYQGAPKRSNKGRVAAHIFKANYKYMAGGQYSSDAWLLAMKGNAPFAGQQVSFDNSGIAQYGWLELGWGKKVWFLNNKGAATFGLHALVGQGRQFYLEKGNIYSDTAGEYIDVTIKGNWSQSSNNGQNLGLGACFGLQGKLNEKTEWHFNMADLGLFFPNKNTQRNTFDTSFRFDGFYVYDVKDMSENGYWSNKTDSLLAVVIEPNGEKKAVVLPFKLTIGSNTFINNNQQLGVVLGYRHLLYALPKLEVWHQINGASGLYLNSNLAYGGWGGLQWTEKVGYQRNNWAIALQLGGMQSMAISKLPFQATAQVQLFSKF